MKTLTKFCGVALAAASLFAATSASAVTIEEAVNAEHRAERAKRDEFRNPKETLEFFGLKENMTVVEIWPAGGWYLDIVAPVVKEKGAYYAAHFHIDESSHDYFKKSRASFEEKIKTDPHYAGIKASAFHPAKTDVEIAPAGSADMVLTFRNVHNWYMREGDSGVENAFKVFAKALKKGGVVGVVDHRMPEDHDQVADKRSGYMKQSYVIAAAEKAGFKLAASSEINANAKDTADHPKGVWTLPPRLANGDTDKDKYIAIGESDRMTLKFVKK